MNHSSPAKPICRYIRSLHSHAMNPSLIFSLESGANRVGLLTEIRECNDAKSGPDSA